jgi:hypothetical protein
MILMQATKWYSQLMDNTSFTGGSTDPNSVNVSAVPLEQIKTFIVVHNTFSHTYYAPFKKWYKDGVLWADHSYPMVYELRDGTTLTVDFNEETQLLKVSQV